MGLWSMLITLSILSRPVIFLYVPERRCAWFTRFARAGASVSVTSELLPLPDTPVTTVSVPKGTSSVTFFRLFSAAPVSLSDPRRGLRRFSGTGMVRRPER